MLFSGARRREKLDAADVPTSAAQAVETRRKKTKHHIASSAAAAPDNAL
jgi:hypothetical protein